MDTSSTNIPNNTTHCHRYHLHHVPHHGQDQQWRKRVTCKHYMKEGCKRGTECWYKHELVSNESIFANIIYGIRGMENKMDTQSKRDEMILKKLDAITSSMSAITAIQSEQNNQLASLKDSIEQNQQKLNQLVSSTAVHTNRLNTMTQKVDKLVKSNKQQMESIEKDMMEKSVKMQSMNRTLCDVQQYLSSTPMESNIAKNKATHSPNINETLTFDTSSFGPVQGFNIDGTQSFKWLFVLIGVVVGYLMCSSALWIMNGYTQTNHTDCLCNVSTIECKDCLDKYLVLNREHAACNKQNKEWKTNDECDRIKDELDDYNIRNSEVREHVCSEYLDTINVLKHELGECTVEWGSCEQVGRQKDALDIQRLKEIKKQKQKFSFCKDQLKIYKDKAKKDRQV
eukprot:25120_1